MEDEMTQKKPSMMAPALGLASLVGLGMASPAWAVNLLLNPSFEAPVGTAGDDQNFVAWSPINDISRAQFANHTSGGVYGLWAKTWQPAGGGVTQTLSGIQPGALYDFSSWMRFEAAFPDINEPCNAILRVTWLDSGSNPVGSPTTLSIAPDSGVPIDTWIELGFNDVAAPVGAAQATLLLGWEGGEDIEGAQSVFFDDVIFDGPGVAPTNSTWIVNGSGDWNVSGNWANGVVPHGPGKVAEFLGAIQSNNTVYTNIARTAGTLRFDNSNTYVIAGAGSLSIETETGNGSIEVLNGSHKLNLPTFFTSSTDITVSNGATLTLGNPTTIKANKIVTKNGTLLIEAPLTLEAGAQLVLGSGFSRLFDAASMGAGSKIDVKNTTLLIDYRGRSTPANTIKAQLTSGSNGGAWNGAGISTSAPLSINGKATALGWKDDTANQQIIVKYTYEGDADLNGQVDVNDLGALATAWQTAGTWASGDFDYSGSIDVNDLGKLATNWQVGVGNPLGPTSLADAMASLGLPGVAVPEPASAGLALAGLALLRRRR
jgi:hypothetical protein